MERFRDEFLSTAGWNLLALLVLCSPLVQGGTPRFPAAVLQGAILALVLLWAWEWGWRSPVQMQHITFLDLLLGLFLFLALFAMLFAPYQHSAARALLGLICYGALYWWLAFHPSRRGFRRVLKALWVQGLIQSSLVWYQWLKLDVDRPSGTFYNPNFMASFLVVALFLGPGLELFAEERGQGRTWKSLVFALIGGGLMAGAVLISGSRGAVSALFLAGAVLFAGKSVRLASGAMAAVLAGLVVLPNPLRDRVAGLGGTDVFAYSRLSIWMSALKMWAGNFWLGVGLGQYKFFSPRYAFPVEQHWAKYSKVAENPHCEYLLCGAEMGVLAVTTVTVAILAVAVWTFRKIRSADGKEKGHIIPLAAGMTAVLIHSAVDFPLHVPLLALLLVFMAASLRLWGVRGPSAPVEFRFRKSYSLLCMVMTVLLLVQAFRPVAGFWFFLGGIGAPQNLLREKWSLEEAPRRNLSPEESITLLERAVRLDPKNASYHNALGSRYFQSYLKGSEEGALRSRALFHAEYASQLNPNNHRYHLSLAQAMQSLSQRLGKPQLLAAASDHLRQALALAPSDYRIYEKLAVMTEMKGDLPEAEGLFRQVLRLEPNYLGGWYNLAVFLARGQRMDEARAAIEEGIRVSGKGYGKMASTPYERALVDFDREQFERWLEEAEKQRYPDPN